MGDAPPPFSWCWQQATMAAACHTRLCPILLSDTCYHNCSVDLVYSRLMFA